MSNRRQQAQRRPADSNALTAFQLIEAAPFELDLVNIVNVTESPVDVSLFHDIDGSVYDEDSALIWNHTLDVGEILCYKEPISGYTNEETIGVKGNGATFTFYGTIKGERL